MWAHLIVMFLGLWLMAAPAALGYSGLADVADDHDRIVGPILATFACVALWEVTRPLRWMNVLLGVWLIIAPWILGFPVAAAINSMLVGTTAAGLSLVRGRLTHRIGGGWAALWRKSASEGG